MAFKGLTIFGFCFVLTACTSLSVTESERAQIDLLGLSKSKLMTCAGIPDKTATTDDGSEYLAYDNEKTVQVPMAYPSHGFYPSVGFYNRRGSFNNSFVYYGGSNSREETRSCTATFKMQQGKVVALNYTKNDSGSLGMNQCYQIVKNCLPELPE